MAIRQRKLRSQLLAWLLVPLTLLLIADAYVSYRIALGFSREAYDRSLVEVAHEVVGRLLADAHERRELARPQALHHRAAEEAVVLRADVVEALLRDACGDLGEMYGPSMFKPAMAGSSTLINTRALAAKFSTDDVIRVGRHRVTPVDRIRFSARATASAVSSRLLKSIPAKPLT